MDDAQAARMVQLLIVFTPSERQRLQALRRDARLGVRTEHPRTTKEQRYLDFARFLVERGRLNEYAEETPR